MSVPRRTGKFIAIGAILTASACGLSGCGGTANIEVPSAAPTSLPATTLVYPAPSTGSDPTPTAKGSATIPIVPLPSSVTLPPGATTPPSPGAATDATIKATYGKYLYDLSGLDDDLNEDWIQPLAEVTTQRLAVATVREANTILDAQEHGVGLLRDEQVTIKMITPTSALIADCQDEKDFYLAADGTNVPDPSITRADFAGAAELVLSGTTWLVDTFSTTHTECTF